LLSWTKTTYIAKVYIAKVTTPNEDESDSESELGSQTMDSVELADGIVGRFARVVVDDAHRLKSHKTFQRPPGGEAR